MSIHDAGSRFLRRALFADAIASGASGLLMIFAAGLLVPLTALPEPLLRGAGLALLPFVAFVLWLARHPRPPRAGVWTVIALNAVWVIESIWLLAGDLVQPTALGIAFVLAMAAAVAGLAILEFVGLRQMTPAATA